MALTNNKKVLAFVEESAQLAQPDNIVWIDGSEAQLETLRQEAVKTGSSVARTRRTRVPSTIGWIPSRRTRCAARSPAAR